MGRGSKELFPDRHRQFERSLYRHGIKSTGEMKIVDNIEEITSELMNSCVDNLEMITDEVISTGTYNDMEDYLNRGIGYTVIIDNKVCGFCTSEYPSKDSVAIGIEVLEEFQKQGYAKSMTGQFLRKASQRGLNVYWECWKNNTPSKNTALSCGFEKVADYSVLLVKR
jgi:GNAT superfamily N-acetyltransferase